MPFHTTAQTNTPKRIKKPTSTTSFITFVKKKYKPCSINDLISLICSDSWSSHCTVTSYHTSARPRIQVYALSWQEITKTFYCFHPNLIPLKLLQASNLHSEWPQACWCCYPGLDGELQLADTSSGTMTLPKRGSHSHGASNPCSSRR